MIGGEFPDEDELDRLIRGPRERREAVERFHVRCL
jgi:hypothetical protein